MKAAVQDSYGAEHITIKSVERPKPGPGQVLVQVTVASMNAADWHLASGEMQVVKIAEGLRRPKAYVKGTDACGVVVEVGPGTSDFSVGDKVFGSMKGAFADYAVADNDRLGLSPDGVASEALASLAIAGVTALQAVETSDLKGASVIVNGASGGVGHYAVQLANIYGASSVDAVCSTKNAGMVKELGANNVIDYQTDDFTAGDYDVVIDCVVNRSIGDLHRSLNSGGRLVLVGAGKDKPGPLGPIPKIIWSQCRFLFSNRSAKLVSAKETRERLEKLAAFHADGRLRTIVDTEFKLEEIAQAYELLGSRRAAGKLLIRP